MYTESCCPDNQRHLLTYVGRTVYKVLVFGPLTKYGI
jgi:hypothetical protein